MLRVTDNWAWKSWIQVRFIQTKKQLNRRPILGSTSVLNYYSAAIWVARFSHRQVAPKGEFWVSWTLVLPRFIPLGQCLWIPLKVLFKCTPVQGSHFHLTIEWNPHPFLCFPAFQLLMRQLCSCTLPWTCQDILDVFFIIESLGRIHVKISMYWETGTA